MDVKEVIEEEKANWDESKEIATEKINEIKEEVKKVEKDDEEKKE